VYTIPGRSATNLSHRAFQQRHRLPEAQRRTIMQVQSYLFFEGRCEEAIEFYRRALGAEVTMLMR
jgi:hypothetical protein